MFLLRHRELLTDLIAVDRIIVGIPLLPLDVAALALHLNVLSVVVVVLAHLAHQVPVGDDEADLDGDGENHAEDGADFAVALGDLLRLRQLGLVVLLLLLLLGLLFSVFSVFTHIATTASVV